MRIIFTRHVIERMKMRNIENREVEEAIRFPQKIIKRHVRLLFQHKMPRGTIEIATENDGKNIKIITACWIK